MVEGNVNLNGIPNEMDAMFDEMFAEGLKKWSIEERDKYVEVRSSHNFNYFINL